MDYPLYKQYHTLFSELSTEHLRQVNTLAVQILRGRMELVQQRAAREFGIGSFAYFTAKNGSKVIGVIPEHLQSREVGHHGISELRIVPNMHERKELMFQLSDAFVILPGGFGTLDETFEMITWRQLRLHDKPIVLLDNDGYWAPFVRLAEHIVQQGFARPEALALYKVIDDVEAVIPSLRRAPAPTVPDDVKRL